MLRRLLLACLSILAAVTLAMCSKARSPTDPAAGGGGGAPPAFNLMFPAKDASAKFVFTTPGSWDYYCNPHASLGMVGTVIVSASATQDSDTVAVGRDANYASAPAFKPATVTIRPGGYVRWVNRSTMTVHTVTRP